MVNATYPAPTRRHRGTEGYVRSTLLEGTLSHSRDSELLTTSTSRLLSTNTRSTTQTAQPAGYTSVAQIINHETQSRIIIGRLRELICELRHLRLRAETLSARSREDEQHINFQSSLHSLDISMYHLHVGIQDLEHQAVRSVQSPQSSQNTDLAAHSRQLVNPFMPSPLRSLLTRARHGYGAAIPRSTSHITSSAPTADGQVNQRLDDFTQQLASLNLRLDRVAASFRAMRSHDTPAAASTTSVTSDSQSQPSAEYDGYERVPTSSATSGLINSITERIARGQEVSPEELELQTRLLQFDNGISRHDWNSVMHRRGLLEISRRAMSRNSQQSPTTAITAYQPPSLSQHHPPYGSRLDDTGLSPMQGNSALSDSADEGSDERMRYHAVELHKQCSLQTIQIPISVQNKVNLKIEVPEIKFRSSHAALFNEPERIFWQGTEYRNCLGLWLSKRGQPAPQEALERNPI